MASTFIAAFATGLIFMYLAQAAIAVFGWRRGEPIASDGGLWRIYWERAFFRDVVLAVRVAAGLLLIGLVFDATRAPETAAFAAGVIFAFFFRFPCDLPVLLLVRYGVGPAGKNDGARRPSPPVDDGREP